INTEKLQVGLNEVICLGVLSNGKEIIPLPKQKEKILNFHSPKTIRDLRKILGSMN
ncbi:hypothetical protein COBT_003400, partial [Conglomerata obtusa]